MRSLRRLTPSTHHLPTSLLSQARQCRLAYLPNNSVRPTNHPRPLQPQRRSFLSNPLSNGSPQTVTVSRTLPYPARAIYSIISDINSYSTFIPYCRSAVVTKLSKPAEDRKAYPEEAKLEIGLTEDMSEEFWSRVYCVPEKIVEAVSGATETTLPSEDIAHHNSRPADDPTRKDTVLTHLLTRWTLRPYPYKPPPASAVHPDTAHKNHDETSSLPGIEKTDVSLAIEFQFASPVYAALAQGAAGKVAEKMIEAFEGRVKAVVEGPGDSSR